MFGNQASMPPDIIFGNPSNNSPSYGQYTLNLRKTLEQAYKLAPKNMGTSVYWQNSMITKCMERSFKWDSLCDYVILLCQ